ncbi:MAG: glycosyltransferase family 2 protein [Desulfuromonadaceae bacterium]|nr:glycosyltransferase family 2 protein [Desulfuromonadaceae bacterium]
MKRVYIIVVNWNGWGDTVECLESLMRLEGAHFRVVVCDNASSDASLKHIADWAEGSLDAYVPDGNMVRHYSYPPVKKPLDWVEYDRQGAESGGRKDVDPPLVLIRTGDNLGFAGGNNIGLRYALARDDFDYVWLLNNDTVVEPQTLASLLSRMAAKPTAGMCGSTILRYHEPQRIDACGGGNYCKWIGLPWHIGRTRRVDKVPGPGGAERWMNYVVGASLLVSRQFLKDIGLMCEEYFLYFEETDWAIRSRGRYTLAYAPESVVYHKIGASIGTRTDPREKSLLCDYYNIRNRIYFTRKFYPYALVTIYAILLLSIVVRLICGQWKRAVMIARLMAAGGKDFTQRGSEEFRGSE